MPKEPKQKTKMVAKIEKRKVGRPKGQIPHNYINLTLCDADEIGRMLNFNLTLKQAAAIKGMSVVTIQKKMRQCQEFALAIEKGKVNVINDVANNLVKKAMEGDVTAMIFYLKTQGRWKEPPKEIYIAPWQKRYNVSNPEDLTNNQLMELMSDALKTLEENSQNEVQVSQFKMITEGSDDE